jgi:hypothetical protein
MPGFRHDRVIHLPEGSSIAEPEQFTQKLKLRPDVEEQARRLKKGREVAGSERRGKQHRIRLPDVQTAGGIQADIEGFGQVAKPQPDQQ